MSRRQVLLDILADPTAAKEGIRDIRKEFREFDGTEAEARITLKKAAFEEQIDKVRQRLERLSKQEVTPKVRIAMARAVEQIDRLEAKLEKLDHKDVKVDVDTRSLRRVAEIFTSIDRGVDHSFRRIPLLGGLLSIPFKVGRIAVSLFTGALEALPHVIGAIGTAFQTAGDAARALMSGTSTVGQVLGSMASGLISLATGGLGAVLGLVAATAALGVMSVAITTVVTAVVSLIAVLGTLLASLTLAAGGAIALGVAFGALLGPGILAVIALVQRFTAVLKARQAHEQELAGAVQAQKTAEQQRTAALDSARQAQERLTQATVEGQRAMAQSARDLTAAEDGLRSSKISVDESRLAWARARKELRDFLAQAGVGGPSLNSLTKKFTNVNFDPSQAGRTLGAAGGAGGVDPLELQAKILAAKRAQESYRESLHHVAQSEADVSSAQRTRADYLNRGIRAYGPYRQALNQVSQANTRVAKAEAQISAAHTKTQQALAKLSTAEKGFLGPLGEFITKFTDLAKIIAAPIFAGLEKAMGALTKLFGDTGIQRGLTDIGKAIGGFFGELGRHLSGDRWRTAFAGFSQDAAHAIRSGGKALTSFLDILRVIAQAAMPTLLGHLDGLAHKFDDVAKHPGKIRSAVKALVKEFQNWWEIAKNVAGVVVGFLRGASGPAGSLSTSIKHLTERWNHWINSKKGQRDVRNFLDDAVTSVQAMIDQLPTMLQQFKDIAKVVGTIAHDTIKVVQWLGNARRNAEHALFGTGGIPLPEQARIELSINKDIERLHKHLTPEQRSETRDRLIEAITRLEKHWGDVPKGIKDLLDRLLKARGHAAGGYTGTAGGWVHPREFVLREAITSALGVDRLRMLNSGIPPQTVFAQPAGAGPTTRIGQQHVGDRHTTVHIQAHKRSLEDLMNEIERGYSRAGG